MNFSISELMSSHQAAKGVIKPRGNILNIEKGSSSQYMPKDKKGQKKDGTGGPSVRSVPNIAKSKGKGKGKVFLLQ